MRVCFVSKEIAGVRGGGIGTYVAEAGKALTAHGHEVWLITEQPGPDRRHLLDSLPGFARVVTNGEGVPPPERINLFHVKPHYAYAYLVHRTLQNLDVEFDYIEFADYHAEGLVVFQEQRLFGTYDSTVLGLMLHSPTWECFSFDKQAHRADLRIRELCNIEDEAISIAPMINSPSRGLTDQVLGRLGLERDVAIIRYPMELDEDPPAPPPPRTSLDQLDFLYYGRIEPRKGIEELVEAFRQMPELSITFVGGDVPYSPYGKSFRKYVERRAPDNVTFAGGMQRSELLAKLREVDVCIFPSLFENWPNVCIEAMAAARVVIGSQHGGMAEMIEHGVSGFHVDGRSPADIVRVIRDEVGSRLGDLDGIGRAAAERIRRLSDQSVYCKALQERIASYTVRPPAAVDPEDHRVTVVIPFYRDRDTIDEAVDSARDQTHRNLEILIVNDGSPLDDADEILERQRAKDTRIIVLHKPNGGLGSARNHAIERATGEFLLFLDADNIALPDYARTGVETLCRCPESAFITPFVRFFDSDTREEIGVYNALRFDRAAGLLINHFGDAGAFFRRSVFVDNDLRYDETLISYEDWALWMRLSGLGIGGERVPRQLYQYRMRSDSMISVDGVPNHPALMGLLIHGHYPNATDGERAALATLFQVAGQSIARETLGLPGARQGRRPPPSAPQPSKSGKGTPRPAARGAPRPQESAANARGRQAAPPPPLRHKIVDEMAGLSHRVPGLNRVLRYALGLVHRTGRALKRSVGTNGRADGASHEKPHEKPRESASRNARRPGA